MKDIAAVAVILIAVAGIAFGADACKEHDHDHAHEDEHAQAQGAEVRVSEVAARAMGLKTVRPEKRRMQSTVFVRDEHENDRFAAVKVTPGRTNGGWMEVVGLPDDDDLEVVKEGAYELKIALASQAGTPAAGHFHADGTFHEQQDH